jgi:palmitoyltransferase ZDHHC6
LTTACYSSSCKPWLPELFCSITFPFHKPDVPGAYLFFPSFVVNAEEEWPPKDPSIVGPGHTFKLPENPWTYENGDLNPNLQPSSSIRRLSNSTATRRKTNRPEERISSVPPYHPDYRPPGEESENEVTASRHELSEDDEDDIPLGHSRRLVRRGSEGYEVATIDREQMLRNHVADYMEEPGRYKVYVPDPSSESDSEDEEMPLTARVESWRSNTSMLTA